MDYTGVIATGVGAEGDTRLLRVEFEYSSGATLTLEGDAALKWFGDYIAMIQFRSIVRSKAMEVQHQQHQQPRLDSDKLREAFNAQQHKEKKEGE